MSGIPTIRVEDDARGIARNRPILEFVEIKTSEYSNYQQKRCRNLWKQWRWEGRNPTAAENASFLKRKDLRAT